MSRFMAALPLAEIEEIKVIFSEGKPMEQIKGDADLICNAGFYDMISYQPVGHLKAAGKVYARENWNCWGYVWDRGEDIRMAVVPDTPAPNYISGVELLTPWSDEKTQLQYSGEVAGKRPRTAMAVTADEILLFCTDEGMTPEEVRQELLDKGAITALILDSGGSSQCDFGGGKRLRSERRVHNYLGIWRKKQPEEKKEEIMKKTVCLDPGHGAETQGKRSPDGSYLEHEFNLDMARRYQKILERHGVNTILTRSGQSDITLAERVKTANSTPGLDLFVSLHSNASGNGAEWTQPAGYSIYTSAAGEQAERNRAARSVLARVNEAGVRQFSGGLFHDITLYVLRNTVAPAILIEHGFHTNREEVEKLKEEDYRERLSKAGCKGILDYLGIAWQEEEKIRESTCPYCGGLLKIVKG